MLRYKQFSGQGVELEAAINRWLMEFEPDVTQMVQTEVSDGSLIISFLFEESFRGQELRFSSEHGISRSDTAPVPMETIPDEPIQVPGDTGPLSPRQP